MKIAYIVDKKIDQSEIESKYSWRLEEIYMKWRTWYRINLSTKSIDFTNKMFGDESHYIGILISLPNNQFYGIKVDRPFEDLFISDEYLNMKIVKTNIHNQSVEVFVEAACFYDDSIYTFLSVFDHSEGSLLWGTLRLEKYSIKKNSWTALADPPDCPNLCVAINQKIIFPDQENRDSLWIYDMSVNSYTYHSPTRFDCWTSIQWFIKHAGKLYLFAISELNRIYCCEDPLSDWNIIFHFDKDLISAKIYSRFLGHYEGSKYYLKGRKIYKFSLEDLKTKKVGRVNFQT